MLAAGGGRRAGGPKALRRDAAGRPWLVNAVDVLLAGGCAEVVVVLGSAGERAQALLADHPRWGAGVRTVQNPAWTEGMSTSLRVGLEAVGPSATAVLVHLVDLPDVTAEVTRRLLALATGPACLARAVYGGAPGHPVLIGRDHLAPLRASLAGDRGAQGYLGGRRVVAVECGDLAGGGDVDGPVGG
ncbi:MAG: NTP transferase domain-containing protein [Friedmanniella sp.]